MQLGTNEKDEKDEEWRARSVAPRQKWSQMLGNGVIRSWQVVASAR